MLYQKTKRNLLRDLQGTLDLIHRLNATRTVSRGNVHRRRSRASPLIVGIQRRVHRVQRHPTPPEPLGNFFNVSLAVGIVQMLPRRENLDRLHTTADQSIQDPWVQPLLHVDIG